MAQRYLRKRDGSDPTLHLFTQRLFERGDMEIVEEGAAADTGKVGEEEAVGPYIIRKYAPGWYEVMEVVEKKLRKSDAEALVLQMMAAAEKVNESLGTADKNQE